MAGETLLVVDDEQFMLDILGFHLEEHGFSVQPFDNANDALIRIGEGGIDAVLTDWMMPMINGREFILALRQADPGSDTPVIVVTAKDLTVDEREFLLSYKCLTMSKPIDSARLLDKVGEVLT